MIYKEKKLATIIYILRYGRMTKEEAFSLFGQVSTRRCKDWASLCEIPGIYRDHNYQTLYSFFYIISHRIPVFYGHEGRKYYLKDIKTKSPPEASINCSSNQTLREYFS